MVTLNWNASLELDFAPIDDLHRQLVTQMANVEDCDDPELVQEWAKLVDCAQALFEREDAWMHTTRFASAPNHSLQHRVVLNLLREGLGMARAGQSDRVRAMSVELAHWLSKHIQSLDAALALHLRAHPEACQPLLH
ncbi:MAG: hemerythrin [Polaromonas sp.]|nr:hemerythrin [Polaromonas sp.]